MGNGPETLHRVEGVDFWSIPFRVHRDVLAADVDQRIDLLDPPYEPGDTAPAGLWIPSGSALSKVRMFMAAAAAGEVAKIFGYKWSAPQTLGSGEIGTSGTSAQQTKGVMEFDIDVTFSGGVTPPDKHPVLEKLDTALTTGHRWYEASGFTVTSRRNATAFRAYNGASVVTANCVMTVTITGSPTGGNFTLSFRGQTTTDIAHNAAASAVQSALQALSTVGTGNATVSGSAGGPYTVTFVLDLAAQQVELLGKDGSGLTGGSSPDVTVAYSTRGVGGEYEWIWDLMGYWASWCEPYDLGSGSRLVIAQKKLW